MTSRSPAASGCFVYITLPGQTEPVTAARFELTHGRQGEPLGRLVYGKRYLAHADAVPLEPLELALLEQTFETTQLNGVFGALRDSSPDYWGRRVIERHAGKPSLTELDYLGRVVAEEEHASRDWLRRRVPRFRVPAPLCRGLRHPLDLEFTEAREGPRHPSGRNSAGHSRTGATSRPNQLAEVAPEDRAENRECDGGDSRQDPDRPLARNDSQTPGMDLRLVARLPVGRPARKNNRQPKFPGNHLGDVRKMGSDHFDQ